MDKKKVLKIIEVYEGILHGKDNRYGLFDCYDTYYVGCWDDDLDGTTYRRTFWYVPS